MKKLAAIIIATILVLIGFSFSYDRSAKESKSINQIKIIMENKINDNPEKQGKYLGIIKNYKKKAKDNQRIQNLFTEIETFLINFKYHRQITHEDKLALLKEVYEHSDRYFETSELESDFELSKELDFDKIFVTMYSDNKIRCCQAGSDKNDIFTYIDEATTRCIKDSRFGGELEKGEEENMEVSFDFLYNKKTVSNNNLNAIEPGIHGIQISNNGKSAYFKSSVQITKNYDLEYALERLCKKAGFDSNCYEDEDTTISTYDTFSFKGDRNGNIVDLYRYNILINQDQITQDNIKNSIEMGKNWFYNNINEDTGLLEYLYYPSKGEYEKEENNHIRQLASIWMMTELDKFFGTTDFEELAQTTYDYYMDYYMDKGDYAFVNIHKVSIANNAFIILGLINSDQYDLSFKDDLTSDEILEHLGNGIIEMQQEDGSYNTKFLSTSNSGMDFYPGESMLALMKLYNATGDEKYLESVEKAFPYYKEYWLENRNTAFVPWHSQVDLLLYEATGDEKYAEFAFEMTDRISKFQQTSNDIPDELGGSPKNSPRISTSSYAEGVNDAYTLAIKMNDEERIKEYGEYLKRATRFILQLQMTEENTFYLDENSKAIGGFKQSLINNQLRNDNTQHATAALMKVYNNELFE